MKSFNFQIDVMFVSFLESRSLQNIWIAHSDAIACSYFLLSVDELRKLLIDKDAYNTFLHSLDQVKIQNNVSYHILFYS